MGGNVGVALVIERISVSPRVEPQHPRHLRVVFDVRPKRPVELVVLGIVEVGVAVEVAMVERTGALVRRRVKPNLQILEPERQVTGWHFCVIRVTGPSSPNAGRRSLATEPPRLARRPVVAVVLR